MNLLETESYSDVVAKGRRRKRPKLASGVTDLSSLIATAEVRLRYGEETWSMRGVRNVTGVAVDGTCLDRHDV